MEKQEKNHAVSHVSPYVLVERWIVTWETGWGARKWMNPTSRVTWVIHLVIKPSPRLRRELVPPTEQNCIVRPVRRQQSHSQLPGECTNLVTEELTTTATQYKPGFHRRHYCTNCDIFFDVNGAVYTHVPQRRLIVPVYDV